MDSFDRATVILLVVFGVGAAVGISAQLDEPREEPQRVEIAPMFQKCHQLQGSWFCIVAPAEEVQE